MSCSKDFHGENCVCNVLREIARVQSDISTPDDCDTSCDRSISDLLGETNNRKGLDTVPLILYCKDSCKPFKGYGARRGHIGIIESSFYFRVQKVKDNCCAVIELLRDPRDVDSSKKPINPKDPSTQRTKHLRRTGICMTVDLKCFCHVTCLPAIQTN